MQHSFAPVRVLFSPFDGSKIPLPFAQKPLAFTNCYYSILGLIRAAALNRSFMVIESGGDSRANFIFKNRNLQHVLVFSFTFS